MKKRLTLLLGEHGLLTDDWRVLPLAKIFNEFLDSFPDSKKHTCRAYRSDLNFLLAYMQQEEERIDLMLLGNVTRKTLQEFIEYRISLGEASSTIDRRLGALKSFDSWFRNFVPGYPCPSAHLRAPDVERVAFSGLEDRDIPKLIEAAYTLGQSFETRLRNGLAVEMLLATGLRSAELRSLTEGQMDASGEWFKNVRVKGGSYRNVYVLSRVRLKLMRWMNVRDRILKRYRVKITAPYPIFVSEKSADMRAPRSFELSAKHLWRLVSEAAKLASIEHVHPHMLRHTRAHEILEQSRDLRLVAQALGHKSLQSTLGYTERSAKGLAEKLERAQRK